jgi:hypothetical protein
LSCVDPDVLLHQFDKDPAARVISLSVMEKSGAIALRLLQALGPLGTALFLLRNVRLPPFSLYIDILLCSPA